MHRLAVLCVRCVKVSATKLYQVVKKSQNFFRESWWVCALAANKIVTRDVNYKSGAEVLSNMVIGIATKYSNKGFML
jgi:hypothetical protein